MKEDRERMRGREVEGGADMRAPHTMSRQHLVSMPRVLIWVMKISTSHELIMKFRNLDVTPPTKLMYRL
jgi:hypothetical protein